jgi:hypothetical protein
MPPETTDLFEVEHIEYVADRSVDEVTDGKYASEVASAALVRTGLTQHNLPADCSNDRADECSTWTNSSKAAISIAK